MKHLLKQAWLNALPRDLFDAQVSLPRAKELFRLYVDLVEIENHSFCNRTCWFCPNAFLDRRSEIKLPPPGLLQKIVRDLREIEFDRTVVWSRYHEPLGHESIYENVAFVRRELPRAVLSMVSNGDYLNRERLQRLADIGLDRLMLDLYLSEGREDNEQELERGLQKLAERTGLTPELTEPRLYTLKGSKIQVTCLAPVDNKENISTRAGLLDIPKLKSYHRTAACLVPIRQVVIDYNGKAVLCCQVRSDSPEHQSGIIGDVSAPEYSLFHLYRDLGGARRALVTPGVKKGFCESCDVSAASNENISRNASSAVLSRMPGAEMLTSLAIRRSRFEA